MYSCRFHLLPLAVVYSSIQTAHLPCYSRDYLHDIHAHRKPRSLVLVLPLKLNFFMRYYYYQYPTTTFELHRSRNIKFGLSTATTMQPTDQKKEIFLKYYPNPPKNSLHENINIIICSFSVQQKTILIKSLRTFIKFWTLNNFAELPH